MTPSPLGTHTVTQIGLAVVNIQEAVRAWAALLGVDAPAILITDTLDRAHTEYQGRPTTARARLAFFLLGQVTLELIEPIGEPSTWRDQLAAHGPSLHHIAFEIKDMPERLKGLAAHGFSLLQRGDYQGGRYVYLDGLERFGTVVELLENDS
jgi:methylmalonyl-CoA/ethylmalonyl-CoA epimerase